MDKPEIIINEPEWKETDRFHVRTNCGEIYVIIEETEYTPLKDYAGKSIVRGRTRYRTAEYLKVHKIGKDFTFHTPFGPMIAERANQDEEFPKR